MVEPRRADRAQESDAADRDGRVETLLVDGLDRYFAGRFEDAIHLWTRVLFLDRSHARARAYIDRARSALAERQRRGDELLQASRDLLAQGRPDAARDLLQAAVDARGDDDQASAVRVGLERLERLHTPDRLPDTDVPARVPTADPATGQPGATPRRATTAPLAIAAGLALALTLVAVVTVARSWFESQTAADPLVRPATQPLAVPSSAEVAMIRARTLYSRGRLAEALQVLERVGSESPLRGSADAMKIEIQQLLLASGPRRPSAGPPAAGSPP